MKNVYVNLCVSIFLVCSVGNGMLAGACFSVDPGLTAVPEEVTAVFWRFDNNYSSRKEIWSALHMLTPYFIDGLDGGLARSEKKISMCDTCRLWKKNSLKLCVEFAAATLQRYGENDLSKILLSEYRDHGDLYKIANFFKYVLMRSFLHDLRELIKRVSMSNRTFADIFGWIIPELKKFASNRWIIEAIGEEEIKAIMFATMYKWFSSRVEREAHYIETIDVGFPEYSSDGSISPACGIRTSSPLSLTEDLI